MYTHICMCIYIYIYISVLLCVYTHSECGSICQVDATVMLTWSKVCITKAITISITILSQFLSQFLSKSYRQLSITLSKSYHLWTTDQICGKLVRFVENWSDLWSDLQVI